MFAWFKKLLGRKKNPPKGEPYHIKVTTVDANGNEVSSTGRRYSEPPDPLLRVHDSLHPRAPLYVRRGSSLQQIPKNDKTNRAFAKSTLPTGRKPVVLHSDSGEPIAPPTTTTTIPFFFPFPDLSSAEVEERETPRGGGTFSGAGASGNWDDGPSISRFADTPSSEPEQCTRSNYTSYTSSDDSSSSSCSSDSSPSSSSDSSSPCDSSW